MGLLLPLLRLTVVSNNDIPPNGTLDQQDHNTLLNFRSYYESISLPAILTSNTSRAAVPVNQLKQMRTQESLYYI